MEPKWRRFEKLVAKIQQELAPTAVVKHDDSIWGRQSQRNRQIDVSISKKIGQYNLLIAMSCKDWSKPVNVNEIDSFSNVLIDIQANKGAMVATNGFTDGAKNMAKSKGIDLYRLIDAEAHEWQTYISIPVICDFRSLSQFQLSLPVFLQHTEHKKIMLYNDQQQKLGNIDEYIHRQWNVGRLPTEPGEHGFFHIADEQIEVLHEGKYYIADIRVKIRVKKKIYFGQLQLVDIKGFSDEHTGNILTNGFTTEWIRAKK